MPDIFLNLSDIFQKSLNKKVSDMYLPKGYSLERSEKIFFRRNMTVREYPHKTSF